jgi:TRAP-type C4-dicarboxylate transport system permease small subunit
MGLKMTFIHRYDSLTRSIAKYVNWVAATSIMCMMLLTTADVVLRYFRHPISGAYEVVGFLGSIAVGFSLAYTSLHRGHVAVSFIFQRLTKREQALIETCNAIVSLCFFSLLSWQCVTLGKVLMETGEVSLTLEMPFFPFVFGISAGCAVLCLALTADLLKSFAKMLKK